MKSAQRLLAAVGVTATVAALTIAGESPASADGAYHSSGSCPSTALCAYYGETGSGGFITFVGTQSNWSTAAPHIFPNGETIDNNSESWENHGTGTYKPTVTLFDGHGYTGTKLCLPNDGLIYTSSNYANIFSSNKWNNGCS